MASPSDSYLPADDGFDGYAHPELSSAECNAARRAAAAAIDRACGREPRITEMVSAIVAENGGSLRRLDSRIKSLVSLERKLQDGMAEFGDHPADAATKVADVLRYTVVLPETNYWRYGDRIRDALIAAGCVQDRPCRGWSRLGYRGRNESFQFDGIRFELQVHTDSSLDVAETTHRLYETVRLVTTDADVRRELQIRMNSAFASVRKPQDVPWVD